MSELAPNAFRQLGATVTAIGVDPDGANINVGCGATSLEALSHKVVEVGADLGVAFDGDGDRMLAVDENGDTLDGDQILAILALAHDVNIVAVRSCGGLGFHRLMAEHGIRVVTTAVGDRYVLEALRREGGILGGEQSGHIVWLRDHVTGDGLAAALLLCGALGGRTLSEAAAAMTRYPQSKDNVRVSRRSSPPVGGAGSPRRGRSPEREARGKRPRPRQPVLGTRARSPRARRGRDREEAADFSATIAALVAKELGLSPTEGAAGLLCVSRSGFAGISGRSSRHEGELRGVGACPGGVWKGDSERVRDHGRRSADQVKCKAILLQGLERLEYRGYDSVRARVPRGGRAGLRAGRRQSREPARPRRLEPLECDHGARAHALGDARRRHRGERASARRLRAGASLDRPEHDRRELPRADGEPRRGRVRVLLGDGRRTGRPPGRAPPTRGRSRRGGPARVH